MHQESGHPELDLLVAERHVLIRRRNEAGLDHRLAPAAPVAPRQLLVLTSPGAHQVPSLVAAVPELLRSMPDFPREIESVWLAVRGLAADTEAAQRLAEELDVEVIAPDGGVAALPGAALYAGHSVGGTGWHRFRPDRPAEFHGARFPLPEWESWLPATPVEVDDVVAVPAPCGLMVCDRRAAAGEFGDLAFGVPVNPRFPKLVVGGSGPIPSPAAVAALLGGLSEEPIMVVPAAPEAAAHTWQAELARRLSRDVVFSAGLQVGSPMGTSSTVVPDADGNLLFRPFAVVLRQPTGGGNQQVIDIAAAPPGWVRNGPRCYRLAEGTDEVVADVVPSGLVLRYADGALTDPAAESAPFDPTVWTLTLGTPGQVVGLPVLAAAESLLAVLPAEQRTAIRVRMASILDEEAEHALGHGPAGRSREPVPPITTTSAAPVSTVSGPPTRQPDHVAGPGRGDPGESPQTRQEKAPAEPEHPPAPPPPSAETAPPPLAEPAPIVAPAGPSIRPLAVPVRTSTAAEQTRFAAAADEAFGEALATVNAALATWPSMRVDQSPGAKADYVAVCLYLGQGEGGAHAINGALRTGQGGVLDGQVPCLMSGIRRLPTHRRAVLRQGKVNESLEHRSTPGTVLTEPGFLAASVDLDVTLPGADLDVLIWPNSARRTSELMLSRPIDEAVFLAGARFKALAVRMAKGDDHDEPQEDDGAPVAPKVAVLFRELTPGEVPNTTKLDERDLAVLAKLDNVLARRQKGPLRLVEDPEATARLTTSMMVWQDEAADAGRNAAVAS